MREIVATKKAPAAVGPYAQANIVGDFIFTSGQIPLVPETGELAAGGIEEQTKQVFANIKAVLEEAGSGLDKIVKTTCFMTNLADFGVMNEIYATYFPSGVYPSRSAFQVGALPKGAMIEIETIAMK